MSDDEFPKFGDFVEEPGTLEGSKVRLDDVVNKEVLIVGYRLSPSKFVERGSTKCLTLQFRLPEDPEMHVAFTGSSVLASQVEKYADHIPFSTMIRKKNRHYEMT